MVLGWDFVRSASKQLAVPSARVKLQLDSAISVPDYSAMQEMTSQAPKFTSHIIRDAPRAESSAQHNSIAMSCTSENLVDLALTAIVTYNVE